VRLVQVKSEVAKRVCSSRTPWLMALRVTFGSSAGQVKLDSRAAASKARTELSAGGVQIPDKPTHEHRSYAH